MTSEIHRAAWVLTGPTGSGKSDQALQLAEAYGAEIIAMDSMTLYRGMDVGTAKPSLDERRRIPHHLIDVLDPWESSNVAWWKNEADRVRRDIERRGKRALFVGGTPLYLKALLHGLFDGPPRDAVIRGRLEAEAREKGPERLHERLAAIDVPTASRLHPNDVRRVVRALEVWEVSGRPMSGWQQEWDQPASEAGICCWWIDRPRDELYARINARVERMIAGGWIEEVRALRELPQPLSREAGQALGYREIGEHLDGKRTLAETIELIQTRTRQFAKRQLTWFRGMPMCKPLPADGNSMPDLTFWQDFA